MNAIILTLCYTYIAICAALLIVSVFNGGCDKTLNQVITKIYDWYRPSYPTCAEWDCKLFNWLLEDDLKIEIPSYNKYNEGKVCTINTPIGEIWVANYPYCFGFDYSDNQSHQPLQETKERLFHRLSEIVSYDKDDGSFKVKKS